MSSVRCPYVEEGLRCGLPVLHRCVHVLSIEPLSFAFASAFAEEAELAKVEPHAKLLDPLERIAAAQEQGAEAMRWLREREERREAERTKYEEERTKQLRFVHLSLTGDEHPCPYCLRRARAVLRGNQIFGCCLCIGELVSPSESKSND